jgi:hypothetical protein
MATRVEMFEQRTHSFGGPGGDRCVVAETLTSGVQHCQAAKHFGLPPPGTGSDFALFVRFGSADAQVYVDSPDAEFGIRRAIELDVDAIQTDDPKRLSELLRFEIYIVRNNGWDRERAIWRRNMRAVYWPNIDCGAVSEVMKCERHIWI